MVQLNPFPFFSIDQLLSKDIATFLYKFNNKLLPKTFEKFFQLNECNNRATRSNSQIIPISCSTNIDQQSMQYLGPKIWNNLPKLVKDCKTVKTFQKQLTKRLLNVDH